MSVKIEILYLLIILQFTLFVQKFISYLYDS